MALPVRWTLKAARSFDRIISYLENEWTVKEVERFVRKTFSTITIISAFPNIYVEDKVKNIRKAFVTEQVSMIYRTFDNHIDILYFWDNRRNPDKLRT